MLNNVKYILPLLLLCLPFGIQAQEQEAAPAATAPAKAAPVPLFGYLSYSTVYKQLPEYEQAQADFAALKAKYEAEATRSEQEFQRKFAEFLQGQKDFPPSIMRKRQLELQDLMEQSINFREQSRKLLAEAERQMQRTVCIRLDEAIKKVGARMKLLFILNTDGQALPYVQTEACVDVTAEVLKELGVESKD